MKQLINNLAKKLDEAAKNAQAIKQLSLEYPLSLEDAYSIQSASLNRRYQRGEKLIGLKMGFTSKAKMEQMGVHDLIWGRLTDAMQIQPNEELLLHRFIHPRVEPEIAFLIKKTINRPITIKEAPAFLERVAPALEIIDSRYQNFKFSLEDVIADNCSSAAYVIGEWFSPDTPYSDLAIELKINNIVVQSGNSKAILGNPLESLVEAARLIYQYGETLEAGMVLLAGAATPAIYLKSADKVVAKFEKLGEVGLNVMRIANPPSKK